MAPALFALAFVSSCAPSRAYIDYTMAEGVLWPGPPEKPRIKYLWKVERVRGAGDRGGLARFIAGEDDYVSADPRDSDTIVSPRGVFVGGDNVLYIADQGASR